jgi:hypothetical protein
MQYSPKYCALRGSRLAIKMVGCCYISLESLVILMERDRGHSPTIWTTLRNEILGNDGLAARGYDVGVDKCIFVADGTYHKSPKMVATTLEAIIGAVFEDGGDEAAMRVIKHLGFLEHRFLTVTFRSLPFSP